MLLAGAALFFLTENPLTACGPRDAGSCTMSLLASAGPPPCSEEPFLAECPGCPCFSLVMWGSAPHVMCRVWPSAELQEPVPRASLCAVCKLVAGPSEGLRPGLLAFPLLSSPCAPHPMLVFRMNIYAVWARELLSVPMFWRWFSPSRVLSSRVCGLSGSARDCL